MIKNNKAILCSIFVIRTKHLLNKLEISDRAENINWFGNEKFSEEKRWKLDHFRKKEKKT